MNAAPTIPAREKETVAEGGAPDAVDGAGVSVVRFEVLLVVADGALVDQAVLRTGEVRRSVPGGEVERKTARLAGDYALRVTFGIIWKFDNRPHEIDSVGFGRRYELIFAIPFSAILLSLNLTGSNGRLRSHRV